MESPTSLSSLLTKLTKKSLFSEAYLFAQVKLTINSTVKEHYSKFEQDFSDCQTFVQYKTLNNCDYKNLNIKICSSDKAFINWLKTEHLNLVHCLESKLKSKKIIPADVKVLVIFG